MKFLLVSILFCTMSFLQLEGQVPDSLKYKSLKPYDFHLLYLQSDSSLLIDVREPFEFKSIRIKGAVNIPASGNIERVTDTLNKNLALFLYCTSGFRSANTAKKLYNKGFLKLYSLEGGINAWKKNRMPVLKGNGRRAKG